MKLITLAKAALVAGAIATLSGCGTIKAASNLEDGAWDTFNQVWDRWVESEGDIAYATMWEKQVEEGIELEDVIDAINSVSTNNNLKNVGELPLSKELEARGIKSDTVYVMSFCNPETARKMLDFSPAMGGFLPCRVTIVGKTDPKTGKERLTLYSMNMDMMVKMGKKLPPDLKKAAMKVRNTIWEMLDKGSRGEF
ncbi:DUF302 domain-containing protein [Galenea microaerophila]